MSRFFATAACILTLLAPAAFAQSSMQHDTDNAMKHDSMSKPATSMAPAAPGTGMSHDSMNHDSMNHDNMSHDNMSHDNMSHDGMAQ